jgi:threonylcarbamoyladenosine tRNA methylthiotransferase MtaB
MKVAFYTLGCKVNQYETQGIREDFLKAGFQEVRDNEVADVYIVNTCTVTNLADRKSRQALRRMKRLNPKSVIAVTGCYAQIKPEEVGSIPGVQLVIGTNEKSQILKEVLTELKNPSGQTVYKTLNYDDINEYEETGSIVSMESRTRAYVKVQEGCNRFCSYCIIPYARGTIRSRSPLSIKQEVQELVEKGFKEIIVTGINTALYGGEEGFHKKHIEDFQQMGIHDRPEGIAPLIQMLEEIPGSFRVRIGSLEPNVVNSRYVKELIKYETLCHHLHLSLQSGSNRILRAMNRRYLKEDYLEIVDVLRAADPNYGITTDIIVGFPGEKEADFQETLSFVANQDLCKVHIFPFSKREGTKAAALDNQVEPVIIKERISRLQGAAQESHRRFIEKNIGGNREVLIEEYDSESKAYVGYSDNYIRVFIFSDKDLLNQMVMTVLKEKYKNGMLGVIQ